MQTFWVIFFDVFQVLIVLAAVGLVGVLVFLAMTGLSLKNTAMRNAKRLYEPPLRSAKSIGVTAKGIVQQEKGRVQHIAANAKEIAGDVKETSSEVGSAAKTVHPGDLKAALATLQMSFRFISALLQLTHAAPARGKGSR